MRYLVTYYTKTGNTRKVAEAIYESLPDDKQIMPIDKVETLSGFDLVFVGFPVMQFGPPPVIKDFIKTFGEETKTALFITHAIPLQSDDPMQQAMLERELGKCRSWFSKSEIGLFHCQGELAAETADELIASNVPMLAEFARLRRQTIGHPDQYELDEARAFARKLL
jgi:flavodoxin